MKTSLPCRSLKSFSQVIGFIFLAAVCGNVTSVLAANAEPPVLLSQSASTRAIALESVTFKPEPFAPTSLFATDTRNRVCIFAMSLKLLPGEGANAFSADAQDATGKLYALKIEHSAQVPGFPGITMFIVRLADEMVDLGDVLLRLNLHGVGSNRYAWA